MDHVKITKYVRLVQENCTFFEILLILMEM
jgi:hypothetical protein